MTPFQSTCAAAKALVGHPDRLRIRDVLTGISSMTGGELAQGRSSGMFGYLARRQPYQFASLFLINRSLPQINKETPFQVVGPTPEQLALLSLGHQLIRAANARVLKMIEIAVGPIARFCDPYALLPNVVDTPPAKSSMLVDLEGQLDVLPASFSDHPLLAERSWAAGAKDPTLTDEMIGSGVRAFDERVTALLAHPHIDDLRRLQGRAAGFPPQALPRVRLLNGLHCLRLSLASVDTILFQSFLADRIPVLNDDNIFGIAGGGDALGQLLELRVQPMREELGLNPHDIVMVAPEGAENLLRGPATVEGVTVSFSQDLGTSLSLELRILDGWLSPLPGLLPPVG